MQLPCFPCLEMVGVFDLLNIIIYRTLFLKLNSLKRDFLKQKTKKSK